MLCTPCRLCESPLQHTGHKAAGQTSSRGAKKGHVSLAHIGCRARRRPGAARGRPALCWSSRACYLSSAPSPSYRRRAKRGPRGRTGHCSASGSKMLLMTWRPAGAATRPHRGLADGILADSSAGFVRARSHSGTARVRSSPLACSSPGRSSSSGPWRRPLPQLGCATTKSRYPRSRNSLALRTGTK